MLQRFVDAGWFLSRRVPIASPVPDGHPALDVLHALGGVKVGRDGRGIECAANSLKFHPIRSDRQIGVWDHLLGTTLVGIADVCHGHAELYIDAAGHCYGLSRTHDAFWFKGESFFEAVARVIEGRRSRPMLRPDQPSVLLYGRPYAADSPELYRYV